MDKFHVSLQILYYWCPIKSIYPLSIFFLYSDRGVVPRWSRGGLGFSGYLDASDVETFPLTEVVKARIHHKGLEV